LLPPGHLDVDREKWKELHAHHVAVNIHDR